MWAGWYERTGPAHEVIRTGLLPRPRPEAGEVLVRLHASGINPSDYKRRANTAVPMEFPRIIPNSDGAGVVEEVGAGGGRFAIGDRVWVFHAQSARADGTSAEYVCLPERLIMPLPDNVGFAEGACLGIPAMTAMHALTVAGPIGGKTVYVPGATGRVGAYAVQFAKLAGARVVASTGGGASSRGEVEDLGADLVLDRRSPHLVAEIMEATQGLGVDHIVEIDLPGNIRLDEHVLAERGAIVSFGAASVPTIPITQLGRRARNFSLHFIFLYLISDDTAKTVAEAVTQAASGPLRHRISGQFALDELARAHEAAERSAGSGHLIVTI